MKTRISAFLRFKWITVSGFAGGACAGRHVRLPLVCFAAGVLAAHALGQSLLEQDIQLGLAFHDAIVTESPVMEGPEADTVRTIFHRILGTSPVRTGPPLPHRIFMIANPTANAFATGGGRVYVTAGLWRLLAGNDGMLAFVIGHEVAHNLRLHGIARFLRIVQYETILRQLENQAAAGSKAAQWALVGWGVGGKLLDDKLSREEEHEADLLGMALAAEAGYHPDYAILAARRMRQKLGDMPRVVAFFAQHPRWKTREERAVENYERLAEIFSSRWLSVDESPGGRPPFLVIYGRLSVERNKKQKLYRFNAWYRARNVDQPAEIFVVLLPEKNRGLPRVVWQTSITRDSPGKEPISVQLTDNDFREIIRERSGPHSAGKPEPSPSAVTARECVKSSRRFADSAEGVGLKTPPSSRRDCSRWPARRSRA